MERGEPYPAHVGPVAHAAGGGWQHVQGRRWGAYLLKVLDGTIAPRPFQLIHCMERLNTMQEPQNLQRECSWVSRLGQWRRLDATHGGWSLRRAYLCR